MTQADDDTASTSSGRGAWASMRVMLSPGELLVARERHAIVVADVRTPGQDATTDRIVALAADAARTGGATGEALVRSAAALLAAAEPDDVPALGLVTVAADRLLVTLTSGMRMAITDASGTVDVVHAEDSLLPVNRVVSDGVATVAIAVDPSAIEADQRSNLYSGVVRAGGLLLAPGAPIVPDEEYEETLVDLAPPPAAPDPAAIAAATDEPPRFETFSLVSDETEVEVIETDPTAESVVPKGDVAPEAGPLVRGIVCSRGHFNPPDARFCERCGISTVHQTHNLVTGARPPLGVLVADDGSVHTLARDYVVGRDPESAEDVRAGTATGLALEDPDLSLSRIHARLVLDGWEVRVADAGSANGTFVAGPGSDAWRRLEPDLPTTITPGTRLRMGSRVLTYESHHRV